MNPAPESCEPVIPGFAILAKLGEGGMGAVYLAREDGSEKLVAIKLLSTTPGATAEESRTRFAREARVMSQVAHQNVVAVLGHGQVEHAEFLVMEYVDGRSLREVLAEAGRLPAARVSAILEDVAAALSCMHDLNIVHRDLKPGNILIANDGEVKLGDFGISSPVAELGDITGTNQFVGSIDYMSPEQRTRLPIDERADQFALAVIAYELLTGKRPLGTYKPPSTVNSKLSPSVDPVLARALEEDPDDRFSSAAEFVNELKLALARPPRRRGKTALVASGVAAVVVIANWNAFFGSDENTQTVNADANGNAVGEPVTPVGHSASTGNTASTAGAATPDNPETANPETTPGPDAATLARERAEKIQKWVDMAEVRVRDGELETATTALTEAIQLDPSDAKLFLRRALVHKSNNMLQRAIDDLAAAQALDPMAPDAWIGAASIHITLKDYPAAIAVLNDYISHDEFAATAFAWRGWAHHGMRRDDLALKDFDRAIELDSDCGIAYQWRGALAKRRRDWQAVGRDYAEFARCNPTDANAHRLAASFYALCPDKDHRDGKLAVEHAIKACELTQWQDWGGIRTLASSYAQAGDFEKAIEQVDRAYSLAPENQLEGLDKLRQYFRRWRDLERLKLQARKGH